MQKSIVFFESTLGFKCTFKAENYAYIHRENVGIRLLQLSPAVDLSDEKREQSCYIDVTNIDALFEELKPKLEMLPAGRVRAPFNQPYGQREFHVKDEDALLIFFGEAIN